MNQFLENVLNQEHKFIVITESWLNDSIFNAQIFDSRYTVFRKDRSTRQTRGGGLLLALLNEENMRAERLSHLETGDENLWVKVTIQGVCLFICIVYIPPSSKTNVYTTFFETLISNLTYFGDKKILVIGDFNINSSQNPRAVDTELSYVMELFQLKQFNTVLNSCNRTLDLILSNFSMFTKKSDFCLVQEDNYHPTLLSEISLEHDKPLKNRCLHSENNFRGWNFRKGDFEKLYSQLRDHNWLAILEISDVDEAVKYFYDTLYAYFDKCFLRKKAPRNENYPRWFSREIIGDIKMKLIHHRRWKRSGLESEHELFKSYRSKIKRNISIAHKKYILEVENNVKHDPKSFWKYVSGKKQDRGLLNHIILNDCTYKGTDVPEAFAKYFQSVYNPEKVDFESYVPGQIGLTKAQNISIENVNNIDFRLAIRKLKPKTSFGPDFIPPFVIKGCYEPLSNPLLHIFNLTIKNGIFPKLWKLSKVTPLHKDGDKSQATNYRPIAILSAPAKLLEIIIHKYVYAKVEPFLIDQQHGFRCGRSTTTNLMAFTDYVARALDNNEQVDTSYHDFAKAFDKVDHLVLLSRLEEIGFSGNLLKLFRNYLNEREQFVAYGGFNSNAYPTNSGVPQGSNLGPLLFLIFINNIREKIKFVRFLLFADDIKLFLRIRSLEDCRKLQEDINAIIDWSIDSKLGFNFQKCSVMCFTRSQKTVYFNYKMKDTSLKHTAICKDLGIVYDARLTFHAHIEKICKSATKMLGFVIHNSKELTNLAVIRLLYFSLVRSILESGSQVWGPEDTVYVLMVEKIQKKFLRYLYMREFGFYPWLFPTAFISGMLGIYSLSSRRDVALLLMAYKLLNGLLSIPDILAKIGLYVPDNFTRGRQHRLLILPRCRTNLPMVMPLGRLTRLINSLAGNLDIFYMSYNDFKREILYMF